MAKAKSAGSSSSASASSASGKVKMVQRHDGFIEPDVEATQEANAPTYEGKNPYRPTTGAWAAWENFRRQSKGQVPTNDVNEA